MTSSILTVSLFTLLAIYGVCSQATTVVGNSTTVVGTSANVVGSSTTVAGSVTNIECNRCSNKVECANATQVTTAQCPLPDGCMTVTNGTVVVEGDCNTKGVGCIAQTVSPGGLQYKCCAKDKCNEVQKRSGAAAVTGCSALLIGVIIAKLL